MEWVEWWGQIWGEKSEKMEWNGMVWRIEKGEKMEWNGMRRMVFPNIV